MAQEDIPLEGQSLESTLKAQLVQLNSQRNDAAIVLQEYEDRVIVLDRKIKDTHAQLEELHKASTDATAQTPPSKSAGSSSSEAAEKKPRRSSGLLRRVAGIDGVRGLAVLAVVIYHFFGDALKGGFLGVDLFFVLSGFLITSLLLREKARTNRIDLKDFWLRRVRRILPAAVTVLVVISAIAGTIGGDIAVDLPQQFFGSLFFVNNWVQIASSQSYFADSGIQIFAHYWSLAVEEQFYLVWPLLVLLLMKRGTKKWAVGAFSLIAGVASALAMALLYEPGTDPTRVYYGTDTHSFGLLIGVFLACVLTNTAQPEENSWPIKHQKSALLLGTLGLIGLLILFFTLDATSTFAYRGGIVLANLAGALVLLAVVRGATGISWIFNNPVLRWLGQRSFSIYLWHWPIVLILKQIVRDNNSSLTGWQIGLIAVAITLPISELSYRFIETPCRRSGIISVLRNLKKAAPNRYIFTILTAILLVIAAVIGMIRAPQETSLEADLRELEGKKMVAEKAASEPAPIKRTFPQGKDISAIGDSVLLASSQALEEKFPGIYIDGEVSRHYEGGIPVISQMIADGTLDRFVVLGFGTNGASVDGELPQILDMLGPDRVVFVLSPYGDRWYMEDARAEVAEAAKTRENVYVVDWCNAVVNNPELLRSDGIHPVPEGAQVYAQKVSESIQQWVDDKKEIPQQCGAQY